MTVGTFERLINILEKAFMNFKFNIEDEDLVEVWFNELAYMDDAKAVLAVKKVIGTCDFVTIKNIKQAYAELDMPVQIDNEEGWGLVEKAIRLYGYMRSDEAMNSLPVQVQKAITYMGGFQSICEAEKKEVIRGQFNKAMASVNIRTRSEATLGNTLFEQISLYQNKVELESKNILQLEENRQMAELNDEKIANNKEHIANLRDIFAKSISNKTSSVGVGA
ncbi:hypothetical protein PBV87_19230 [Niameybacter massiliensis]|uniref:Replicative helicase inhibitor G39P N-terminal domain-containing protein n=1 Tax=Holtiella tumoricola TaxID=3018743 RepID=A0AA42J2W4_9FIRM|nr:hypothetical protein [Holtiella tumoricola]MDA3733606.1 hypothetical protein [Holtiella tumoricola]